MIADVTHFTIEEGGDWHPWPFPPNEKPSNPELLTNSFVRGKGVVVWRSKHGGVIKFHSIKLSDGAIWDCVNGFRATEDQRPH